MTGGGACFDDLRSGNRVRFSPPARVLIADTPEDVLPVLDEVERATTAGCWAFGFVAYEAASGVDPALLTHPRPPDGVPYAWFGLTGPPRRATAFDPAGSYEVRWERDWTEPDYLARVRRVRERIAEGETYQANLTVRLRGSFTGDPAGLYRDLALAQRGGYHAKLDLGDVVIASASPELFFELRGDTIRLRPMKGTVARGRTREEDRVLAELLRTSVKERAENIMIVDLMRNDVSRIAVPGTVAVPSLLALESYPTVRQLTSEVTADLRPGTGPADVFAALFPCGSITGAPKASTMRLIREVEDSPRGVYCGAIGWIAPPASPTRARFSVAIRTAVVNRAAGIAEYGTGGGITWSSDPAAEHREVLLKAAVLERTSSTIGRVPVTP
ncbi:hypothetical protein GCM10022222_53230 [Amycolatopsis ultiminotia]|uniref:Chorismate-utilising enzyme C-terminal domain-containing protein n=1 Tax=Amycolatopsis ultiminotia TaxID=543629 RepID=A0ABP6X8C3_9PSEU